MRGSHKARTWRRGVAVVQAWLCHDTGCDLQQTPSLPSAPVSVLSSFDRASSSKCVVPKPSTVASSENLLEMPVPAAAGTLGWDPAVSFNKASSWFKSATHWTSPVSVNEVSPGKADLDHRSRCQCYRPRHSCWVVECRGVSWGVVGGHGGCSQSQPCHSVSPVPGGPIIGTLSVCPGH